MMLVFQLKKLFICKVIIVGLSIGISSSAIAANFATTEALAKNGNAVAQYDLSTMYLIGEDVGQDDVKAAEWILRAADQGNAVAQHNLGLMYMVGGIGVEQDYVEAVKWYQKSDLRTSSYSKIGKS